jgi:hypothetical protein
VTIGKNMPEASFLFWQKQFNTEYICFKYLQQVKWPDGFICPSCGNDLSYEITCRHLQECT